MLGDENNNDLIDLTSIDRAKCALLVIDELGDPTGGPLEPGAPACHPADGQAHERAARAAGMPVVFTNDAHLPGIDRELALWGAHGIAGTPEAQTSPLLDPQPSDYVVEKRRYSGFFQTGLLLLLNELGVDTLICCGMDTKHLREAYGGRRLLQQFQHHRGRATPRPRSSWAIRRKASNT